MINVGIIGHEGIIGSTLFKILQRHPFVRKIHNTYSLKIDESDLIFLCVPNGQTIKYVERFFNKRIIDLSVDNRSNWIYGIPEVCDEKMKNIKHISNPGCYANSIILSLLPIKNFITRVNTVSVSGISSTGKRTTTLDNFRTYNKLHNHIPEIKKFLSLKEFTFIPHCSDSTERGIISTNFVEINKSISVDEMIRNYQEYYHNKVFIKILSKEEIIQTKDVIHTNNCHIKIMNDESSLIIISALDNILKGGASQAVQNMNCMYGLDQRTGLNMLQ